MTSISINYGERRPPEPPKWQWGGPKPDGYAWPSGSLTPGLSLVCETCGAHVEPDAHEKHDAWHGNAKTPPRSA